MSDTFKIQIELPVAFTVTSRDRTADVPLESFAADIIARAVTHGLGQVVGDAGAGALESVALDDVGERPHKGRDLTEAQKAENAAWKARLDAHKETLKDSDRVKDRGLALMEKRLAKLVAGEWDAPSESSGGFTDVEEAIYALASKAYKQGHKDEWKNAKPNDRKRNVLAWVAESSDGVRTTYENAARAQVAIKASLAADLAKAVAALPDA